MDGIVICKLQNIDQILLLSEGPHSVNINNEMMTLPKITIITPSYNQGQFIEQTICSVIEQDYPNVEYIVMDGGSSDQTISILKQYDRHLIWRSESDRGQAHAINKGVAIATGEILGYLNSDDYLEPGALYTVGKYFADHPGAEWLTGQCRIVDEQGTEVRKVITKYKNFWLFINQFRIMFILNYISQPATFWRKRVTDEIGGFNEELHLTLDYDYWIRIGSLYKLHIIRQYISNFRVHSRSKGGTTANQQFNSEYEVASKYTTSSFLLNLHQLHNMLILSTYKAMARKKVK